MKKIWKKLSYFFLSIVCIGLSGCKMNVDTEDYIQNLGFWKTCESNCGPRSVELVLNKDVDFLVWTKEDGEFIELAIPGKIYKDTFYFSKGKHTFTFQKPGVYILNIHYKTEKDLNNEDFDFRGKVYVGDFGVRVYDDGYAEKCKAQGLYRVVNNSNYTVNELYWVTFNKRVYDRTRQKSYGIYDFKFKYTGLNIKKGCEKILLFPATYAGDTRYGSLILIPLGNGSYSGQTTNRALDLKCSPQGFMGKQTNGTFFPIGNNQFECAW